MPRLQWVCGGPKLKCKPWQNPATAEHETSSSPHVTSLSTAKGVLLVIVPQLCHSVPDCCMPRSDRGNQPTTLSTGICVWETGVQKTLRSGPLNHKRREVETHAGGGGAGALQQMPCLCEEIVGTECAVIRRINPIQTHLLSRRAGSFK